MRNDASDGLAGTHSNRSTDRLTEYDDLLESSSLEVAPSMPDAATDADVIAIRAVAGLLPGAHTLPTGFFAVPASAEYRAMLRTTAARFAARLSFTLDETEDLRIAVDEACGILISLASPEAELRCQFNVTDDTLTFEASVTTDRVARLPSNDSFPMEVLRAMTDTALTEVSEGTASIRLTKRHRGETHLAPDS
jgi:serine/threonine-protein kinase RsbW